MTIIERVEELESQDLIEEALTYLNESSSKDSGEIISDSLIAFTRGRLLYKQQLWGESQNQMILVDKESKFYSDAQNYIASIQSILGFVNRDLMNP